MLHKVMQNGMGLPPHPEDLILPAREGQPAGMGVESLPATAKICSCENVSKATICDSIRTQGLTSVAGIKACTKAGTGCGGVGLLGTATPQTRLKEARGA